LDTGDGILFMANNHKRNKESGNRENFSDVPGGVETARNFIEPFAMQAEETLRTREARGKELDQRLRERAWNRFDDLGHRDPERLSARQTLELTYPTDNDYSGLMDLSIEGMFPRTVRGARFMAAFHNESSGAMEITAQRNFPEGDTLQGMALGLIQEAVDPRVVLPSGQKGIISFSYRDLFGLPPQIDRAKLFPLISGIGNFTLAVTKRVIPGGFIFSVGPDREPAPNDLIALLKLRDIVAAEFTNRALYRSARVDALTGVLNRAGFERFFEDEINLAMRHGRAAGVFLFFDGDGFKTVNDTHGHLAGDAVLAAIGEEMRASNIEIVGRFGGDEFVAFAPAVSLEVGREEAAKMQARIAARRFIDEHGQEFQTSVSIGLVHVPEGVKVSVNGLTGTADSALYQAKRAGKGVIVSIVAR